MSTNATGSQGSGGALDAAVESTDLKSQEQPAKDSAPKTESKDDKSPKNDSSKKDAKTEPAKKEKGPGPWEAELEKRGLRSPEIDAYMREVIQPYITELEGRGAGGDEYHTLFEGDYERAELAAGLMQALIDDPAQAYKDLGELLDLSAAEGDPTSPPTGEPTEPDPQAMPDDPRLAWVEQEMEAKRQAQEDQEYNELLSELSAKVPGFDPDGYHLAVLAAKGDMEQAFRYYMDKIHREPAPEPAQPDVPVLDNQGGTAPRQAQKVGLDGAIDETLAEMRAARQR